MLIAFFLTTRYNVGVELGNCMTTRYTFKSVTKLANDKGLNLMKYGKSTGYSLLSGTQELYGSGYGSTLAVIVHKLENCLTAVEKGQATPNGQQYPANGYHVGFGK